MDDADPLPPGGFFPVGLDLTNRLCVVVGADREALAKDAALRAAGASVRCVADGAALRDEDVASAVLVISTPRDEALSERLRGLADRHRFLLCCIDQPAYGSVAMPAVVHAGPARIGISTGGVAPRVAGILKERLQAALDGRFARFLERLAVRRRENRRRPDAAGRRAAMLEAAEGFDVKIEVRYPQWFEEEDDGVR